MSVIPNGWVTATLQDVAKWSSGGTPARSNTSYYEGTIPWVKTGELGVRTLTNSEEYISEAAINASSAKIFPKGSVAVAMYGATIGKTSIFGIDAATNQACAVGIPDAVTAEFLYYFIVSQEKAFIDAGQGGAQPNISQGIVKDWPILLPPAAEQTRIVAKLEELLSELDAGVAELKAAQKKLHLYRQSLLKAAVEGSLTAQWRAHNTAQETGAQLLTRILKKRRTRWEEKQLAKFKEQGKTPPKGWQSKYSEPVAPSTVKLFELPEGWVWASVEQLSVEQKYGSSSKTNEDPNGIPVLRMGNIQNGDLDFSNLKYLPCNHDEFPRLHLQNGDLLFNRTNSPELVGKTAVYRSQITPCSFASYLISVRFSDGYLPEFVSAFINSAHGRSWIKTVVVQQVGQANVNGSKLSALAVPVPPLEEQQKIILELHTQLNIIVDQLKSIEITLKQSAAQRQNILRTAFAGELVPQDPSDEPASVLLERIRAERAVNGPAAKRPGGSKPKATA